MSEDLLSFRYRYDAIVERVVDADTIDVSVDLGFHTSRAERLRLARIDAWETRGEERPRGLEAKSFVETVCPVGSSIFIQTIKDKTGKYGRFLAEIWYQSSAGEWVNLNTQLVELGHATYY